MLDLAYGGTRCEHRIDTDADKRQGMLELFKIGTCPQQANQIH